MPALATDGLPDPARVAILACIHDPRHAGQSDLYRTCSLRTSTLLAPSAAAATDPRASEAFAAGHLVRPHAREEWIEIPVPSIVDPAVFEATRVQLEENRKRKRERARGQCWLLQGLTVCRCCGYAYYGKTAPRSRKYDPMNTLRYYRCTGADGYRFSGKAVCHNGPVRGDQLEQAVWNQVRALLEEPCRVAGEYRRRMRATAPTCRKRSFVSIGR